MSKRIVDYLKRWLALRKWKRAKMEKWLAEGQSLSEIKQALKNHKIKF